MAARNLNFGAQRDGAQHARQLVIPGHGHLFDQPGQSVQSTRVVGGEQQIGLQPA